MPNALVRSAREGHIAVINIASPATHNALDWPMRDAFNGAISAAAEDDSRVVLIVGERGAFATGHEAYAASAPAGCASVLASVSKPTIAFIDGQCVDMGLELALACDIRIATPASRFAMRQIHQGAFPWDGGTQRLPRLVGRGHALRMLLAGDTLQADEALRVGLVEQVGGLADAVAWAERVAAGAPIAAAYTKEAAVAGLDLTLGQGLRLEADLSVLLQSTEDRQEGLRSFKSKQPPEFRGR